MPNFKTKTKKVEEEAPKIQLIAMPKLEEEPEIIEVNEDVKPLDLAPPMQQDVPQLVQPDSFVQKIQPPPPEGVTISASMNIVPEIRDPNMFKGMKVFDISMLDQVPTPKFQAKPQYPFEMRRAGIAGEVVVDLAEVGRVDEGHHVGLTGGHVHLRQHHPGQQQRDCRGEVRCEGDRDEQHVGGQMRKHHGGQQPEPFGQRSRGEERRGLQ